MELGLCLAQCHLLLQFSFYESEGQNFYLLTTQQPILIEQIYLTMLNNHNNILLQPPTFPINCKEEHLKNVSRND